MSNLPATSSIGSTLPSVKYPILLAVLQMIADGATPSKACKDNGLTLAALKYHLNNDEELKTLFDDALEVGSDALADLLVDIDTVHSNPAMASLISKNIQWVLERRKPDKFGARVQVSMENNVTKTLLGALDAAIHRIPMASPPRVATVVVDVDFEDVGQKKGRASLPTPSLPAPPEGEVADQAASLRELGLA